MGARRKYDYCNSALGVTMKHPQLPKAIVESQDFADLNVEQQERFSKRLSFARDVLHEASLWLEFPQGEFRDFADGLELDLTSAMSVDLGDTEKQVSTWFTHSMWTFEIRVGSLAALLSMEAQRQLDERLPLLSFSQDDFHDWLKTEVKVALNVFSDLQNAQTFDQAIACLIAADTFLSRLLAALSKWRLWLTR